MKIAFNGVGCGWGNNGGTQSIFRMAAALTKMGHDVELWSEIPNKFTWFMPEAKLRQTTLENAPEVDVLINTGCNTTMSTYRYPRKKVGVQWLRGHEVWAQPEDKLFKLYGLDMPLWANSEWIADLARDNGIRDDVEVQYCGVPWRDFYPVDTEPKATQLHIGGLWSGKPLKRANDILELAKKESFKNVRWLLFGNEPRPELPANFSYIQRPDINHKRALFTSCDIWFAPSEMEGLHIPPMEAALCGAAVVANGTATAGNMDYVIDGLTGLHYADLSHAVECIEKLRDNEALRKGMVGVMQKMIRMKIGDVETNAQRMIARLERLL